MGSQTGLTTMLVMLVLRIAVPVAATFAIGYALRRLDARWQEQQNST